MIATQKKDDKIALKVLSNELNRYGDDTKVYLPRATVSYEIVKLQNDLSDLENNQKRIFLLMTTFHSQTTDNISKLRFIQMTAKMVSECFKGDIVPVYLNDSNNKAESI